MQIITDENSQDLLDENDLIIYDESNIFKNITNWYPPSGTGYISGSDDGNITTLSGISITTLSGINLIVDANIYNPKFPTVWTKSTKEVTAWRPLRGGGYVVSQGTLDFVSNLGNYIVDNLGNNIVTTSTYTTGKNPTVWTVTGA